MVALDAAGLTVDMLRDMSIDSMSEDLEAAFAHFSPDGYGSSFDFDTLAHMPTETVDRLRHTVKGFALELQVEEAIHSGAIEMPEGATDFQLAPPGTPAVDGYFLDDNGNVIEAIQIKATGGHDYLADTLADNPDIPIYANTEAAEAAAQHGLTDVTDTGIELGELMPESADALVDEMTTSADELVDEFFPQLTATLIAADVAWTWATGGDTDRAVARARRRGGNAIAINAAGTTISTLTGLEAARFGVVAVVTAGRFTASAIDARVTPGSERLGSYRSLVSTLGTRAS